MNSLAYGALWIFVFSVPWEKTIVISQVNVISRATGALALVLGLLAVLISGRLRRWHVFHVAALLFVIWAGCGLLILHMEVPKKFWTFVQLFLVLWMIWELAPSRGRQLGLLAAYVFGALVAALGTIMLYRSKAGVLRRFSVGEGDANDLAMALALALPMAWYLGMTYRQPLLRWICRAYLLIGLLALGLTGSRGGMLASVVALLIVPLTIAKLSSGRRAVAIVLLVISGALALTYVPESLIQRLASTRTEVTEEGGLSGRYGIWKAGVYAFARRPVVGYGTDGFQAAVAPWGVSQVAHNSYLSVLVEQGLVGFLLYATMLGAVFLAVLSLPQLERRFALVLLATLLLAMLPLTWEDRKPVWIILAVVLGLSRAQVAGPDRAVRQARLRPAAPIAGPRVAARSLEPLTAPGWNAHPDTTV